MNPATFKKLTWRRITLEDSRYCVLNTLVSPFVHSPTHILGIKEEAMPARVLIVDDHELVRKGVRRLFAKYDSFEVCGEAQNGMEAIRMVPELSPDVVILDLSMPGMNGFETAANIVTIAPSIRIVLYSAHEVPASAQWVGADA